MSPAEQLFELRTQTELARVEGNYTASQESVEQVLLLIQVMENHYLLADTLFDQACFAQQQGKYHDARHLAQRTIKIAESKKLSHFSCCPFPLWQWCSCC
jgi:ATP/maltotriose-dependent transcriptional regulator MalT